MKNTESRISGSFFITRIKDHENQINQIIEMGSPLVNVADLHFYSLAAIGNIWQRHGQYVLQI